MKRRNPSVDVLKFFAALLIVNSHMDILYPNQALATGGAIGDVLFFFCSGFTLFLGRTDRFDNWYKRRIRRIYPTVFAVAIVVSILFNVHDDMKTILMTGGGWFVSCIMIYYVFLYFIKKYFFHRLTAVFLISSLLIFIWYLFEDYSVNIYGSTYFKWGFYFLFMLLGAIIGSNVDRVKNFNFKKDLFKLLLSVVTFYGMLIFLSKYPSLDYLQIISIIPLLGVTFFFYKICNSKEVLGLLKRKYTGRLILYVSALTLEVYLIQDYLYTDKMNSIFPLNLLIMLTIVVSCAYLLKAFSRFFLQTFNDQNYDWKAIFSLENER